MDTIRAVLIGIPYTIGITIVALLIGAVAALPLTFARRSTIAIVRIPTQLVLDVLRGIPPIVWLFIIFFGVGNEIIEFGPFTAGSLGLGFVSAAYLAEIYRGGLSAVHTGQWQASSALGMSATTSMVRIVGPQAFRVALPSVSTYAIGLLKDSSVVSAIGATDMVFYATAQARATGDGMTPFLFAAACYIVLGTPLAYAARRMDFRLRQRIAR